MGQYAAQLLLHATSQLEDVWYAEVTFLVQDCFRYPNQFLAVAMCLLMDMG